MFDFSGLGTKKLTITLIKARSRHLAKRQINIQQIKIDSNSEQIFMPTTTYRFLVWMYVFFVYLLFIGYTIMRTRLLVSSSINTKHYTGTSWKKNDHCHLASFWWLLMHTMYTYSTAPAIGYYSAIAAFFVTPNAGVIAGDKSSTLIWA